MSEYPQSETAMLLRIQQLEEALRFYANEDNYKVPWKVVGRQHLAGLSEVAWDSGKKARAVLPSEAPDKEEGEDG